MEYRRKLLAGVKLWGYQLRLIRFPDLAASPFDLVVIDHALSAGRRFVAEFEPGQIASIKRKPDGSRRIVLAYMSVGEAERYRFYWNMKWYDPGHRPSWLGAINPVWDGNYAVHFWEPEWQRLLIDDPDSYLQRIRAQGFDGVYIDRADMFQETTKIRPQSERDMVNLISRLASAARARDPNFLIVMQNAEELAANPAVLDAIDAIAKEDLFYGEGHDFKPNTPETIADSLANLRRAKKAGKQILVVEYLENAKDAARARRRAEQEGFVVHFTARDLGDVAAEAPDRRLLAQ